MSFSTYDRIGIGYHVNRLADPRIAARLLTALNGAESVLNVGAGTGSYEPQSPRLVSVEPSATMISQRATEAAPCVQALAEALPFANDSFDAAMAVLTIHHWLQIGAGLSEMRRVAAHNVVILTWDPQCEEQFWLTRDYLPEILEMDRVRFPTLATLQKHLGPLRVDPLPIPWDCTDGFRSAYWRRPQMYLEPSIQRSISSFAQLDRAVIEKGMLQLARDLDSGEWSRRNPDLASRHELDLGYRIVNASSTP